MSQGNVQTKKVLESTNLNIDDFVDDPLSYVKTPSNKVLGFTQLMQILTLLDRGAFKN